MQVKTFLVDLKYLGCEGYLLKPSEITSNMYTHLNEGINLVSLTFADIGQVLAIILSCIFCLLNLSNDIPLRKIVDTGLISHLGYL